MAFQFQETFELGGDPDAIIGSAAHWTGFGTAASQASGDVSGLDSGEFVGDEGDTYRSKIDNDMTPHLQTTGEAWSQVGTALKTYGEKLRTLQQRMAKLKADAQEQQGKISSTAQAVSEAKGKDQANAAATTPDPNYTSGTADATTAHQNAVSAYNGSVAEAKKIRDEHDDAVRACCDEISSAKGKRFQKPPGFWDKVGNTLSEGWDAVKDGLKAGLSFAAKYIAPILDIVSMVSGVLALIPVLAPIMGPIALATGAASLLIKVGNKLLNGEGSWLDIGISALALVPGVKPLTTMGKLGKMSAAGKLMGKAGNELGAARKALTVAKNSGKGIKAAKQAVRSAEKANTEARAAYTALKNRYDTIDDVWKWTERGVVGGLTAGNTASTYAKTGSWEAALAAGGASLLGYKVNPNSKQFTAIQSIIANGGATANQAYQMTVQHKWDNPMEWAKLVAAAGKTGISGTTTAVYSSAGTHPNGSSRDAFELPNHWG